MKKVDLQTPLDYTASRYSGFTRDHWEETFKILIAPILDNASPKGARQLIPGQRSHHGRDADELEGFSRSFIMAGPWLSGSQTGVFELKGNTYNVGEFYRRGLVSGTDPKNPEYWGDPYDYAQHLVELASVAWSLWLGRKHVWEPLSSTEKEQIARYLQACTQVKYHPNNWLLFNVVTNTVMKRLGLPHSQDQIEEYLSFCERMYLGDGWYRDGNVDRIDYYSAWAFHYYTLIWLILDGDSNPARKTRYTEWIREFTRNFRYFLNNEGAAPCFGRSMVYRFGYLAPFALGKFAGILDLEDGEIKTVLNLGLKYFITREILTEEGFLSLGYIRACEALLEHYSCGGSPYWAVKAFNALLIPRDDSFWTAEEVPLPIHRGNYSLPLQKAGLLVVGNRVSGQVYLLNGKARHDNPEYNAKYTKFIYSTLFPFDVRKIYGNFNCDNWLQFSADGIVWKERWKMETLFCEKDFISFKYPMREVDEDGEIITRILVKEDFFVLLHSIRSTKNLFLREGGFPLGFDTGPERIKSLPGAEWASAEGRCTFLRNLHGWKRQIPARPFAEDTNGVNVRYRYSITPRMESGPVRPGTWVFATQVVGRLGEESIDAFVNLIPSHHLEENGLFLRFYDGEEAFITLFPEKKIEVHLNGKPIRGNFVLARVAKDSREYVINM